MNKHLLCLFTAGIFLVSCEKQLKHLPLFSLLAVEHTGMAFFNRVEPTEDFNIFSYRNFYNGGGVAIGDVNNDGLSDIYLTGNMEPNKLFLNKGNLQFEDVTQAAGVAGTKTWSTGVVLVDINADGWLDIYVCNAGYNPDQLPENELFVNQQDGTFREEAVEWGLNEAGYTTHAAFFDYDLDGDLDVYILNNSFIPVNTLNYSGKRELYAEDWPVKPFLQGGGDKLLRNEGGQFVDVSREAGIYGSLIGFGLGITVGDVNGDHWPDMYISNDFFERDYLYVNQKDGTFREEIKDWMEHLSLSSMGADMADINNDGYPEIFVTEMLPETDYRRKTTSSFENYNTYYLKQQRDFYHQYMQNTLQYNNRDASFSEIAYFSGVAASDWSWGALMFDADNDGLRDLYVCNGVYQDVTDQDFIDFFANEVMQKMALTGKKEDMQAIVDRMPSIPQKNKFYRNKGDLTFEDVGVSWGFDQQTFSNGGAYGDLDNDGDLDLVINNLNQTSMLFRNNTTEQLGRHFLAVSLKGKGENALALGAKVRLHAGDQIFNQHLIPSRGFQSSVDYRMTFGLGDSHALDSLVVIWPDRTSSTLYNPPVDTLLQLEYDAMELRPAVPRNYLQADQNALLAKREHFFPKHNENDYIDFFQEGLTMRMLSREGPRAAVGDIDGDGRDDVVLAGAAGQPTLVYRQNTNGFEPMEQAGLSRYLDFEDTEISLFDADNDGDLDLYIGSGGNQASPNERQLLDRFFRNDGKGLFQLDADALPQKGYNTAFAIPLDLEGDGDLDILVGSRSTPRNYGTPPPSFLLENDGSGRFSDVTASRAPDLAELGMLTAARLVDIIGDEQKEVVITGEWMAPKVLALANGKWELIETDLDSFSGWWYAIASDDVDGDGDQDLILGNRGENFYFKGSPEQPAKLWIADFDGNGTTEKIMTQTIDGRDMPIPLKKELTTQLPSLKKENLKHTEYAEKTIHDLFSKEVLDEALVLEGSWFSSTVAINQGNGAFELQPLPKEVQFSCICDITCSDLNGDGLQDLIMAGNDRSFTPQFSKLDAGFGHVLLNDGQGGYLRLNSWESGLFIRGDVKQIVPLHLNGNPHFLFLRNDQPPLLFEKKGMGKENM